VKTRKRWKLSDKRQWKINRKSVSGCRLLSSVTLTKGRNYRCPDYTTVKTLKREERSTRKVKRTPMRSWRQAVDWKHLIYSAAPPIAPETTSSPIKNQVIMAVTLKKAKIKSVACLACNVLLPGLYKHKPCTNIDKLVGLPHVRSQYYVQRPRQYLYILCVNVKHERWNHLKKQELCS
jgi:hypothetical protein